MAIDVERLLEPVSPELPCGENLEYDPAFIELDTAAERKPEQQYGDTIIPAVEPDWPDVASRAAELLGRTKDLRAAYHLVQAALRTEGLPGFASALALMRGYIERYWDSVHPQLDPEDDNDPTMRVNVFAALANVGAIINPLRDAPLVRSRALGSFGLRAIAIANGEEAPPAGMSDDALPQRASVEGAFAEADLAELEHTRDAIAGAMEHVRAIESGLNDRVPGGGADLSDLTAVLRQAQRVLGEALERRGTAEPQASADAPEGTLPDPGQAGVAGEVAVRRAVGPVASRADAIRLIDEICRYFERNEPSSPVPILLMRAKRLVDKDFIQILEDLLPDAVSEAQRLRGPDAAS